MNKIDFLDEIRKRISNLPAAEIEKSIGYYEELIEDRMEEGASEQEAVAAMGNMDEIVTNIMYDQSIPTLVRAKMIQSKKETNHIGLWIAIAILTCPIWIPLSLTVLVLLFTLYLVVWIFIISLYTIELSFALTGLAGVLAGIINCFVSLPGRGLMIIGISLCLFALAVFMAYPVFTLSKQLIRLTGMFGKWVKSLFIGNDKKSDKEEKTAVKTKAIMNEAEPMETVAAEAIGAAETAETVPTAQTAETAETAPTAQTAETVPTAETAEIVPTAQTVKNEEMI